MNLIGATCDTISEKKVSEGDALIAKWLKCISHISPQHPWLEPRLEDPHFTALPRSPCLSHSENGKNIIHLRDIHSVASLLGTPS